MLQNGSSSCNLVSPTLSDLAFLRLNPQEPATVPAQNPISQTKWETDSPAEALEQPPTAATRAQLETSLPALWKGHLGVPFPWANLATYRYL